MGKRMRIGLAGFGAVTWQLVPSIQAMPNAELVAVAAPRQESRDRAAQQAGVETFPTVEAMCASPNVDAVWVCTPNSLHAEHAITAADHGKHVINEKPMAVTLEQADAIVEAVKRNGARYVQAHSKLFDPPVRRMREIVSSGDLGRLIQIHTWEYKPWITGAPRRDEDVDTSGGVVFRQGPHQADVVRGIGGGMVKSARAITGRWHPDFPLGDGDYSAFVELED
jgi:phthalate 4,5-cis-dihydrodiol dehydrogenase